MLCTTVDLQHRQLLPGWWGRVKKQQQAIASFSFWLVCPCHLQKCEILSSRSCYFFMLCNFPAIGLLLATHSWPTPLSLCSLLLAWDWLVSLFSVPCLFTAFKPVHFNGWHQRAFFGREGRGAWRMILDTQEHFWELTLLVKSYLIPFLFSNLTGWFCQAHD